MLPTQHPALPVPSVHWSINPSVYWSISPSHFTFLAAAPKESMTYAFTHTENFLLLTLEGEQKVEGGARGNGNKAVYTAALVADRWAGAENAEKLICDGRKDRQTDRPTDQRTNGPKSGFYSRVSSTKKISH